MDMIPLDILIGTEATRAVGRRAVHAYFDAKIAFGAAERAESRARSDAKRAFWRAERARVHAALMAAHRAIVQYNAESAARCARWEADPAVQRGELAAD
jgi:hypothetical protein